MTVGDACLGDPGGQRARFIAVSTRLCARASVGWLAPRRTGEPGRTWDGAVVAVALRGEPEHMGEAERANSGAALSGESASLLRFQSVLV